MFEQWIPVARFMLLAISRYGQYAITKLHALSFFSFFRDVMEIISPKRRLN